MYIIYYTILYYTILYYTILYYTILYYTILYYTILYYTILYYTILYYTILYYTILYVYFTFGFVCSNKNVGQKHYDCDPVLKLGKTAAFMVGAVKFGGGQVIPQNS